MNRMVFTAAGVFAMLAAQPASAAGRFFVFGDSLVDSGNAFSVAPERSPPADGYFPGRFSNGYNFADYLAGGTRNPLLFTPEGGAKAAALGGTNFSVGGAQTAEVRGDRSPSFLEQIATYKAATGGGGFTADDRILLTFGGNDIQTQIGLAAQGIRYDGVKAATAALQTGLDQLLALGARNILITGQADVGDIPKIRNLAATSPALAGLPAFGTLLSDRLNTRFRAVAHRAANATDADIVFFDLLSFERTIIADPASFGLTDIKRPCKTLGAPYLAQPCGSSLYFDEIHPTTYTHGLIADGITGGAFNSVPEPASWAMLMIGFGVVGMAARRRRTIAHA